MRKIVIGLSGGMDSATLLGTLINNGFEVHCCTFSYGSKHNVYENKSAEDLIQFYQNKGFPIHQHFFNLEEVFKPFKSALLLSGEEIPEGHYEDETMKKTVVPGRNLIFASIMAGLAESLGIHDIALGVHSGDHAIYPDCRPEFIHALNPVIQASSAGSVSVIAPFLHSNKKHILQIGFDLYPQVPYYLTRTCYKDQQDSCGKCGACQERLEAFDELGQIDHIKYEE